MNALALMATLGLDSSGYEKGLDESKRQASSFASTVKKVLGGIAIGAAVKKTLDGITAITRGAVDAYKNFEQLEGGIQTLFGNGGKSFEDYAKSASDSMYKMGQRGDDVLKLQKELIAAGYDLGEAGADGIYGPKTKAALDAYAQAGGQMVKDAYENTEKAQKLVMENADRAFMTAGLSANEYMETVTSFSASLIQSLGGDTEKAAELSDRAILDMADNANKMGSDMGSIQTAYAGFAKQNYTMLDNLKLGYGGTKTEMERLIKDANEMRKAQGKSADLTIEKYADVIEAIHTVQENMGITGTTAEEAEHTIQGSLSSTKAAWQNLLIAMGRGQDVKKAMGNLIKSAKNVVRNVVPIIKNALTGIGELITELGPVIIDELPGIIEDLLPTLINAVGALIASLARALPGILSALWSGIQSIGGVVVGWFEDAKAGIAEIDWESTGTDIFNKIKDGVNAVVEGLKKLFEDAAEAIGSVDWEQVGKDIWESIKSAFTFIYTWFFSLFSDGRDGAESVDWEGLGQSIKNYISEAFSGIYGLFKGFFENAVQGIQSIDWKQVGKYIWNAIKSAFDFIYTWFFSIFSDGKNGAESVDWVGLGQTILNFILSAFNGLGDMLGSLFSEAIKSVTGIEIDAGSITTALETVLAGIAAYKTVEGISTIISGISAAFTALKTAGLTALPTNPVALAIGLAVSAIVLLWNKSEAFRDAVGAIWEAIQSFIADPIGTIKGWIDGVVGAVQGFWDKCTELAGAIGDIWNTIVAATTETWNKIVASIQEAIDKIKEFLGLNADPTGWNIDEAPVHTVTPGGYDLGETGGTGLGDWRDVDKRIHGHASAMRNGEILHGITPFGVDSHGTVHYGGEAGDEAIVGVSSLRGMIHQSVSSALGGLRLQVVLDSGVLVGEIAGQMDSELNEIAGWKGGGHAL